MKLIKNKIILSILIFSLSSCAKEENDDSQQTPTSTSSSLNTACSKAGVSASFGSLSTSKLTKTVAKAAIPVLFGFSGRR